MMKNKSKYFCVSYPRRFSVILHPFNNFYDFKESDLKDFNL